MRAFVTLCLLSLVIAACSSMKQAYPLLPVAEYEKMIVGRMDADYVGTDNCVARCHSHDRIRDFFRKSIHGEQIKPKTGLPLVNCESCHGPGSLAIARIEAVPPGQQPRCDTSKLLDLKRLPPQAQSLICLKCHSVASSPTLAQWATSPHALAELGCSSCHKLHEGPHQKVPRERLADMCYGCHPEVRSQFNLISHHPVRERKMTCLDCHEPHGSSQPKLLKGKTARDACTRCHMDKNGPFVYEHGDVTENCANCHMPHGAVNRRLLSAAMPFLCLQCHSPGHSSLLAKPQKGLFANRCSDCHSAVHGSNSPDNTGRGTLRR